jgi:hypothetical protein
MSSLHRFIPIAFLFVAACSGAEPVNVTDVPTTAAMDAAAYPDIIALPNGFSPEGVVVGTGHDFFVGSLADGSIYKGDLRTGAGGILVTGQPGLLSVGLAHDDRSGFLFAAGGFDGTAYVYDGNTGALMGSYAGPGAGFLNDVIVTRDAAYFTDSFTPTMFRLALGPAGELPPAGDLEAIPLGGDFTFIPTTFNANGIEATSDGSSLLVVNGSAAELYRVDPETGEATKVNVDPSAVVSGDGLVLVGLDVYVVQNFLNQISEIRLAPDLGSGIVQEIITSPAFRIPTTADVFGSSLYAVNARFDVAPPGIPNTFEFEVVRVPR